MAGNDERINLLISAAVDGLKNVEGLISDLQELEASGRVEIPDNTAHLRDGLGETSEEMRSLAARLSELRDQQGLVTRFTELKRETKALADQQKEARDTASRLGRALAETEEPTSRQVREFERARKAARDTEQAWIGNNRELNQLRGELGEAGISTSNLADEQVRINREIAGVNRQASDMADELESVRQSADSASQGTDSAAQSAKDLGDQATRSSGLLGKLGSGLKTVATAVAGFAAAAGASVATLTVFSRRQASLADELTNTSNAIGVNREQLQLWRIAGDRVGLSGEKVSDILRSVSERLGEFSRTGGGEAAKVMESLNLKIRDFRNLSPDEQMRLLAQAIGEIGSKSEQVALLEKLASDASQLQPLLEDNAAGLEAIFEQARQEGAIYSEEELNKLNRANDIYNDIDLKLKGLIARISAELAPTVAEATEKLVELFSTSDDGESLIDVFKRLVKQSGDFVKNLAANGPAIAERFGTITTQLQVMGNVASAVFNGMMTAVSSFQTLLSGSFAAVTSIIQAVAAGLETIGVISEESYGKVEQLAERARAKTKELASQTADYASTAVDAGGRVADVFTDIENAADNATQAAEDNVYTLQDIPKAVEDAGDSAADALKRQQEETKRARDELSDFGIDGNRALTGISTEAQKAIDSIDDMAETIAEAGLEGESAAKAFQEGFEEAISKINSKEGLLALQEEIENLEKSGKIGGEGAAKGLDLIRQKFLQILALQQEGGDDIAKPVREAGEAAGDASDEFVNMASTIGDNSEKAKEFRENWKAAWGGAFGEALTKARESVTALSNAARNLFETRIGSNQFVQGAVDLEEALEKANQEVYELNQASQRLMNNSFGEWFNNIALQAARTRQGFYEQAIQMEELVEKINSGAYAMDELAYMSQNAANRFNLLDSQQLSGLQSAIDAARSKLESLNATAESTLNSLRQRLADIRGDTEEAQRLQYEAERRRLEEQLAAAREAGATEAVQEYEEALRILKEINRTEQQNRREEQNERERAAADRQREQERAERERQQYQREINQPATTQTTPTQPNAQRIELTLPTGGVADLSGDPQSVNDFLEFLSQAGMRTTE